mmetsp:Transcript_47982/g.111986  ORF Transcript_47982/g.111986 Transcript_47982/m.111986 type:complete len:595 (-) Transcript_47982:65-1849(-)
MGCGASLPPSSVADGYKEKPTDVSDLKGDTQPQEATEAADPISVQVDVPVVEVIAPPSTATRPSVQSYVSSTGASSEPLVRQYAPALPLEQFRTRTGTAPLPLNLLDAVDAKLIAASEALNPPSERTTCNRFSLCAASLKQENMVMSDAAVVLTVRRLVAEKTELIAWLETDTRLDERATWRRLANHLEEAGYRCFTDGGVYSPDGSPTPALQMSKETGSSRYTALLLAVRQDVESDCVVASEILQHAQVGGGSAKGVLQRSLTFAGDMVVCLGVALSPKDVAKEGQVNELQAHSTDTKYRLHLEASQKEAEESDRMQKAAETLQRGWRGVQSRRDATRMAQQAINLSRPQGGNGKMPRFTYVCFGDMNNRLITRKEWVQADTEVAASKPRHRLTPQALDELVELLRSEAGRKELLKRERNVSNLAKGFYDKTAWWQDGGGRVQLPSYKRTPYFQLYPKLAEQDDGQFVIRTTEELWKLACEQDPGVADEIETVMKAEQQNFVGLESGLLKQEFFGMRGKAPKSKEVVDATQTYLNQDSNGEPVYLQLGWLDSVGLGRGHFSNFREQSFRRFDTVPQIRAFDHLMTLGVIDFSP